MQIKGTAVRATLAAIEHAYGAAGLAKVHAALPAKERTTLTGLVLASTMYPVALSAALHEAIRTALGNGTLHANRKVGIAAGQIDWAGVYRVFLQFSSYEVLLRSMNRAFRQYNSQGELYWDRIGAGEAEGGVRGVSGYTEPMWTAVAGRLEAILVLAGAASASAVLHDVTSEGVLLRVRWKR